MGVLVTKVAFGNIFCIHYSINDVIAILQTIKTKDVVNQNVLVEVDCSFFTFLIISTRLMQNTIAKIGITYTIPLRKNIPFFYMQNIPKACLVTFVHLKSFQLVECIEIVI